MKHKKVYIVLLFVSLCFLLLIFYWLLMDTKDQKHMGNLKKELVHKKSVSNIDWEYLVNENSDTVAWIKIKGTKIDYPIVQSEDNSYYLTHSFDQTKNRYGWIFSDFRNNLNRLNQNSIIYGHGLWNGEMLGSLRSLLDSDFFRNEEHHLIYLSTPQEDKVFQIFSVYRIEKERYYLQNSFRTDKEFESFIHTILGRSYLDFQQQVNVNDRILTLSTCENDYGMRIVVHAKLIKQETQTE